MWPPNEADTVTNGTQDGGVEDLQTIIDEMRVQDFDSIRFATYRTACKLRFVQTKTNVHLVDIWNMIESFRENGLNAMPTGTQLKTSRLELLLTSVFHNLNKRLPTAQQIDTDKSISMLLSFLLGAYDRQRMGRLTVFAVKVALATFSAGKLVDKLRYIFSQISDSTGIMDHDRFAEFLQHVLALPTAVFEAPTFGYSEQALQQCFKKDEAVNLNHFLDVIMSETCPPCLMWLPLLHRMASVEHVYHPVVCDACQVRSFTGFRYKCQRCTNYQLCQSCFWRGRTSQSHSNEHEMKEYSSYKSPTKQIAHSIHKSLQCMPIMGSKNHKEFSMKPQRPLDLANIVPMTPASARHHPPEPITEWTNHLLPGHYGNGEDMDDEHKLIARYSAKLAGRTSYPSVTHLPSTSGLISGSLEERNMIAHLEEEREQMLRELSSIEQQNLSDSSGHLNGLKERKDELEAKMRVMQQTRRELMQQLEQLMAQLNTNPVPSGMSSAMSLGHFPEPLAGVGSMVSSAFREHSAGPRSMSGAPILGPPRAGSVGTAAQLQGDLLQCVDVITSNIHDLVTELDQATEESQPNGYAY